MKKHSVSTYNPDLPKAYLANGLIGLRISQLPFSDTTALVNGFIGECGMKASEEYADAPNPIGVDIAVEGRFLSDNQAKITFDHQSYDFAAGELNSFFHYCFEEVVINVEVLTLCNRHSPCIIQQETKVQVNTPCQLILQAQVLHRNIPGSLKNSWHPKRKVDALLEWESIGGLSSLGISYVADFVGDGLINSLKNDFGNEKDRLLTRFIVDAEPGKIYTMQQFAAMVPSVMHSEPHLQAARMVTQATWYGFDRLRNLNREKWTELWKSCPRLVGADDKYQDLTDACFFYLHSSVSRASPCSVAPMGLSRKEGYSGHVFWDTETFMMPATLLASPDTAKAMMEYRYRHLESAGMNAMLNGRAGIQFPWQSGNYGDEVTSYYSEGHSELHINVDVAFAVIQYVNATGDETFFRQKGWPIVEGIANWITSLVEKTNKGYEISHVVGIAEDYPDINNNSTLNILSIRILNEACKWSYKLGVKPPAKWKEVADNMVIPLHSDGYILPHDGYEYLKGGSGHFGIGDGTACCVEAMMMNFPFEQSISPEIDNATMQHYLPYLHTHIGMPMMSATLMVWACRGGDPELALKLLEGSYFSRITDPYMMLKENNIFRLDVKDENFVTCQGGLINALTLGLCGLYLDDGDFREWNKHAVILPKGWERIEIDKLYARGEEFSICAENGAEKALINQI